MDVINRSQEAATIPLLVAVDGEWGVDMRLDSVIEWPYQLALGSATDFDPLYQMGKAIAKECSDLNTYKLCAGRRCEQQSKQSCNWVSFIWRESQPRWSGRICIYARYARSWCYCRC